jgi:hypothetical protein
VAWNTPRAWAALELVTAGNMNTYISDLLSYLKGSVGTVQIDSAENISGALTTGAGIQVNTGSILIAQAGQILQLGSGGPYWQATGGTNMQTAAPLGTNSTFSAGAGPSFVASMPIIVNQAGDSHWKMDSGGLFVSAANGGPTPTSTNYHAAFTVAPIVVATMTAVSGGDSTSGLQLTLRGINTTGFIATVYNTSGSSQSMTINWIALGH